VKGVLPGVKMECAPCPLGCSGGDLVVLTGRDRLHGLPGKFTVVRCRGCGLLRTDPRPTRAAIGGYYPETYGPHLGPDSPPGDSPAGGRTGWGRHARRVRRYLLYDMYQFRTELIPDLPPGRMLEFGCGTGAFLRRMEAKGWEVEGLEPSERAARMARSCGLNVRTESLETAADPPFPFDLAVGWMALEHLHEPLRGLSNLWRWVRSGGRLVFSVPNAKSMEFRLFGDAWYALQLPTHLYHFTPETISLLLASSGWRMERVYHQRVLGNLAASLAFALEDRGLDNRLTRFLAGFPSAGGRLPYRVYPLASLLAAFGQTGRMTVWARRRDD